MRNSSAYSPVARRRALRTATRVERSNTTRRRSVRSWCPRRISRSSPLVKGTARSATLVDVRPTLSMNVGRNTSGSRDRSKKKRWNESRKVGLKNGTTWMGMNRRRFVPRCETAT